jgi:hypothetical protein
MAVEQLEMNRIRRQVAQCAERPWPLGANDEAPFVIFLTERMLADIEACGKSMLDAKRQPAWPSLN